MSTVELIENASVYFSINDHSNSEIDETKLERAVSIFNEYGFVRLMNVFQADKLARFTDHYRSRYRNFLKNTSKDNKRPLYTVDVEGPFTDPYFYAHPFIHKFATAMLGEDCILGAVSTVISFPGAPDQYIHRDTQAIFGDNLDDYSVDKDIPPYALTVLIPQIDFNKETGCTRVWPGSHKSSNDAEGMRVEPVDPEVPYGSVLITNSKLIHCGAGNFSEKVRPLLYMTYHRRWFRDFWGYETRPPISISASNLKKVPSEYRHLFSWIKDPYKKMRLLWKIKRLIPYNL